MKMSVCFAHAQQQPSLSPPVISDSYNPLIINSTTTYVTTRETYCIAITFQLLTAIVNLYPTKQRLTKSFVLATAPISMRRADNDTNKYAVIINIITS